MTHKITIIDLVTESTIWLLLSPNVLHLLNFLIKDGTTISPTNSLAFLQTMTLGGLVLICILTRPGVSTFRRHHILGHALRQSENMEANHSAERTSADTHHVLGAFAKDIRSPVVTALNHLQNMPTERDTETTRAAICSLGEALQILDDASELTALTTIPERVQATPVDLRHILVDLYEAFAPKAAIKTLGFEFYVDDTLPKTVELDKEKLTRVLSALLDHAITSTSRGHVYLSLQTVKCAKGVLTLAFSITDTGQGFDPQEQKNLLNPLHQLENRYACPGNRFGLAICQRLLKRLGSELHFDSRLGKGTTVSFLLHATSPDIQTDDSGYPSLLGLNVLYAEDEPLIRALTMQTLLQQQISVTEAQNGHDLLVHAQHQSYDMVLIDLQMPGMDGVEVIRALKQHDPESSTPIFVLTSHATSRLAEAARSAGADRIFTKPLQLLPLASAYHTWQHKHRPLAKKDVRTVRSQNALLNLKNFASIVSSTGANFENRYLPEFKTQLTQDLEVLDDHLAENSMEAAAKTAHTCVGLCEIMGADALSKKLRQIETACRTDDAAGVLKVTPDLPDLLRDTCEQMKVLLQHMPQSKSESDLARKR